MSLGAWQPLRIRQAEERDIPVLARHRAAMFRDMGALAAQLEPALEEATAAYLHQAMPGGEYLAWIAEEGAAIIGGAGVQLRTILPRPRPGTSEIEFGREAIVLNVYVEPSSRRRGVAEALMHQLLRALDERGIHRVVLHASPYGRRLYERLGFVQTNEMRLERGVSCAAPRGAPRTS